MSASKAATVAQYILARHDEDRGPSTPAMTPQRLQFLLYQCQGWTLAVTGAPLFEEDIWADPDGPTVRSIWDLTYDLDDITGDVFAERLAHTGDAPADHRED